MLRDLVRPLISLASEALNLSKIAEARDVKFSERSKVITPSGIALRLGGLVFHSSLGVRRIDFRHQGDAVIVEIRLAPAASGMSGSFLTDIPLRPETNRVL